MLGSPLKNCPCTTSFTCARVYIYIYMNITWEYLRLAPIQFFGVHLTFVLGGCYCANCLVHPEIFVWLGWVIAWCLGRLNIKNADGMKNFWWRSHMTRINIFPNFSFPMVIRRSRLTSAICQSPDPRESFLWQYLLEIFVTAVRESQLVHCPSP